jgi:fibro-slime domain-containing protein
MNNGNVVQIVRAFFKKPAPYLKDRVYHSYRTGLSSVLAAVIMLSAVSAMGTTAVYWSQSNLHAREQATGTLYSNIINKVKESLVLEHFWYNTPSQNLNIVLKNTGEDGLHVIQIEVDGTTRQITHIINGGIVPDGIYTGVVHYYWLGNPLEVYVTTDRGSIFHFHLVSPTDGTLIIKKVSKLGNGNFSFNGDLGDFNVNTTGWNTGANLDKNGNLVMQGVIHDFNGSADIGDSLVGRDPDFEMDCSKPPNCPFGNYTGYNWPNGTFNGIVLPDLGADHTPVYNNHTRSPFNYGMTRFNQWYHDTPGVNKWKNLNITLIKQPTIPTTWKYTNYSFFPIDNQLFCQGIGLTCSGKVGSVPHNFGFTFMVHSTFTYQGGEIFNFTGDDDVFVFINHKLAIDLGGVHAAENKILSLDQQKAQLGITLGGTYDFDFFYAERHTTSSDIAITTSIQLGQNGVGTTSAFFVDPGKYTINELVPSPWTLIGRQCDNGYTLPTSTAITITVPKGVTTCTFTNTK